MSKRWLLLLLALAVGLYLTGRWVGASGVRSDAADAAAAGVLEGQRQMYEGQLADLMGTALVAGLQRDSAVKARDAARREADRLRGKLAAAVATLPTVAPDTCRPWWEALQVAQQENDALRLAGVASDSALSAAMEYGKALEQALALATQRADTLERTVAGLLKAKRCRILGFIPCPSRVTAFLAGSATVLLLGLQR